MEDISVLRNEDLKRRLQTLSEELEELEEERDYVLKQTGLHLPGHTVKRYEAETQALKESIAALTAELDLRK
ncbi:hypothetical protein [Desulfosporosinus sp.]|uniref:hypothetical protein n=1 Tax=Desulfosporosinus sp. TaxID=157907 RepID=UPI000E888163|nr:hypothetical protein [Desulfosporosinus sp.]MBC2723206.1 hypothetical protein [Desulfosporosinus sp.]MBC2729016.1 hypothetical protein [Desulfosporosinus sp.]HBV86459.1 hypothetical protein [Desulfosporosinus sp.]